MMSRSAFAMMILVGVVGTAGAQPTPTPQETEPVPAPYVAPPSPPTASDPNQSIAQAMGQTPPPPEEEKKKKEPKAGDFDAGAQLRLPSGPDEEGEFATWNWVAVDVKGKYYLLKSVTLNGHFPLAVKKPDMLASGADPRLIGGMMLRLDATLPRSSLGVTLTTAYMREGAMLLSEKDFPLFVGDFQPGISGGILAKLRLGSLLDFALVPAFAFQKGTNENYTAIQIPTSLIIKLGSLLKVSADLGIFTGDDFSLRAKYGGRIYAGGAIDVKVGPIALHAGAGVASLFTDPAGVYPTLGDSVYIDLNVKYVK
ncbi:MAG: hypothetical protein H0T42_27235 [Deltaproteobacteria bacterium]|nr:hypothetical protein [Deltaproteobacteria bacterium]